MSINNYLPQINTTAFKSSVVISALSPLKRLNSRLVIISLLTLGTLAYILTRKPTDSPTFFSRFSFFGAQSDAAASTQLPSVKIREVSEFPTIDAASDPSLLTRSVLDHACFALVGFLGEGHKDYYKFYPKKDWGILRKEFISSLRPLGISVHWVDSKEALDNLKEEHTISPNDSVAYAIICTDRSIAPYQELKGFFKDKLFTIAYLHENGSKEQSVPWNQPLLDRLRLKLRFISLLNKLTEKADETSTELDALTSLASRFMRVEPKSGSACIYCPKTDHEAQMFQDFLLSNRYPRALLGHNSAHIVEVDAFIQHFSKLPSSNKLLVVTGVNQSNWPKIERKLSEYQRNQPHLFANRKVVFLWSGTPLATTSEGKYRNLEVFDLDLVSNKLSRIQVLIEIRRAISLSDQESRSRDLDSEQAQEQSDSASELNVISPEIIEWAQDYPADIETKLLPAISRARNTTGILTLWHLMTRANGSPSPDIFKGFRGLQKAQEIEDALGKSLIGQKDAIKRVAAAFKTHSSVLSYVKDIRNFTRPLALFLAGSSGIGKTETAKLLAKHYGAELVIFPLNQYSEPHTVSGLLGSPPGYVGYTENKGKGSLHAAIEDGERKILLFDEVEKAAADVSQALLGMLDEGEIEDRNGNKYSCSQCVIIFTTNLGSSWISKTSQKMSYKEQSEEFIARLPTFSQSQGLGHRHGNISPEFLGRTRVVLYRPLPPKDFTYLAKQEVKSRNVALASAGKNYRFNIDETNAERLGEMFSQRSSGVRGALKYLEDQFFSQVPPDAESNYIFEITVPKILKIRSEASKSPMSLLPGGHPLAAYLSKLMT